MLGTNVTDQVQSKLKQLNRMAGNQWRPFPVRVEAVRHLSADIAETAIFIDAIGEREAALSMLQTAYNAVLVPGDLDMTRLAIEAVAIDIQEDVLAYGLELNA